MELLSSVLLLLYVFASFKAVTTMCSKDPTFFWTTPRTRTVLEGYSVSIDCALRKPSQLCSWSEIEASDKRERQRIKEGIEYNCSITIDDVSRDIQLQLHCIEMNATNCSQTIHLIVIDSSRKYMEPNGFIPSYGYNGSIFINDTKWKTSDPDKFEPSFAKEVVYIGRKPRSFTLSIAGSNFPDVCFIIEGMCFRAGERTDKYIFGDFYEENHVYTAKVTVNATNRELNESLYVSINDVFYPIILLYENKNTVKKEEEWSIAEMPVIIVSASIITIILIIAFYLFILPICFPDKNKKEVKNRKMTTSTIATEIEESEALMRSRKISMDVAIQTETV